MIKPISVLAILAMYSGPAFAESTSFRDYYQALQKNSREFVQNELRAAENESELESLTQFYEADISSRFSNNKLEQNGQDSTANSYDVNGNLRLSSGTTLSATWREENTGFFAQQSRQISVSQDLWRNRFGRSRDLAATGNQKSAELISEEKLSLELELCSTAVNGWQEIANRQKQKALAAQRIAAAEELEKQIAGLFKERLVRRLEYLNTKESVTNSKLAYERLKLSTKVDLAKLSELTGKNVRELDFSFTKPDAEVISAIGTGREDLRDHPASTQIFKGIELANNRLEQARENDRFNLQAFVNVQENESAISPNQQAIAYGLSFSYNLSPTNDDELRKAALQSKYRELEKDAVLGRLSEQATAFKVELNQITSVIALLRQKKELAEESLKLAKARLAILEIELNDFITFQNNLYAAEEELYQAELREFTVYHQFMLATGRLPTDCKGV